jgi:mono/diheme cytochrome c family protein
MKRFCGVAVSVILILVLGVAQQKLVRTTAQQTRAKYLVENVALCGDCHSPHNEKGEVIVGQELQGSILPFGPTVPIPNWAANAPGIAGASAWNEADIASLLNTGGTTKGIQAGPPMPQYRFTREDSEAIAAYLKSLPAAAKKPGS